MSNVVVVAPNARTVTLKVNPGDYLTDVLARACKRLNLPEDRYIFKHKTRQVDLSIPFRTAGLVPGAKLELVLKSTTPSAVSVALQLPPTALPPGIALPDGGRLVEKFQSTWTVWKVLRQFESGDVSKRAGLASLNLTARGVARTVSGTADSGSGQLYYEVPVLNIMGRELASFADFQKTLSQLGHHSGRVLMRLAFKKTDKTLFEAMEEMNQFFREEEAAKTEAEDTRAEMPIAEAPNPESASETREDEQPRMVSTGTTDGPSTTTNIDLAPPQEPAASPLPPPSELPLRSTSSSPLRDPLAAIEKIAFYSPSESPTIAAAHTQDPDSAFAPSLAHAQLHQARLLASSQNKRLPSDQELEAQAAQEKAKVDSIKSVLIKVRFPDNWSADWKCSPAATASHLYGAVRGVAAAQGQPFRLLLPGRVLLKDSDAPQDTLTKGYKLSGRVLVSLVWDDAVHVDIRKQPFLRKEAQAEARQVVVQDMPQSSGEEIHPEPPKKATTEGPGSRDNSGAVKMPKWMKLGKK